MDDASNRKRAHRNQIRETVERIVPSVNIDVTKVLSDEELEQVQRETRSRIEAEKLAAELGRAGLRERLKRSVAQFERQITRVLNADKVKTYLNGNGKKAE